jgi:hypothetical protein
MLKALAFSKKWYENIFLYILYATWIIYFASIVGTISFGISYLGLLREILKIYISLFLIIKFNPFQKTQVFSRFDRRVAFEAGLFLFSSTILNKIIDAYISSNNTL